MSDSTASAAKTHSRRSVLRAAAGSALAIAASSALPSLDPAGAEAAMISPTSVGATFWGRPTHDLVVGVAIIRKGGRSTSISFPGDNSSGVVLTRFSLAVLTPRADVGGIRIWYQIDDVRRRFTIRSSAVLPGDLAVSFVLVGGVEVMS